MTAAKARAVRFDRYGGREVLYVADIDRPVPGAGEVLLRVHAVSLNHRDLLAVEGKMAPPALPFVPGSDASGEVVADGTDEREGMALGACLGRRRDAGDDRR